MAAARAEGCEAECTWAWSHGDECKHYLKPDEDGFLVATREDADFAGLEL